MICKDLGNSRLTRDMVSANGCKVLQVELDLNPLYKRGEPWG